MRGLILVGVLLACAGAAQAASVAVDHGNIVVNGKAITHGGRDFDPVVSPDGKHIVFLRLSGGPALEDCATEATTTKAQELWGINADGSGAARLLALRNDPDAHKALCAFQSVQFSSDGRRLYFLTPAWATSDAVHVYDFRTGKERFFLAGNSVRVLATCEDKLYRDDIAVSQHRYYVFGGSYDWVWLFSPTGKEVGLVGEDEAGIRDGCE